MKSNRTKFLLLTVVAVLALMAINDYQYESAKSIAEEQGKEVVFDASRDTWRVVDSTDTNK